MKEYVQGLFEGERALFTSKDLKIYDSVFANGESPLKESENIELHGCIFKWKYPLWYCRDVKVRDTTLLDTARSGIWYTENISMTDCTIEAPKTFRRSSGIKLFSVGLHDSIGGKSVHNGIGDSEARIGQGSVQIKKDEF